MEPTTEKKKSRVEQLVDAHPYLTETQASALLIVHYKKTTRDPSCRGPEYLEIQMVNWTDILCRMTEYELRNELAKAAEQFPCSWEELEKSMFESDQEDD